jgi:starch-binding outer membrane protein, SusD/RagB family
LILNYLIKINMKNITKKIFLLTMISLLSWSCKDLNTVPYVGQVSELVYKDVNSYKEILAKLYAGLAVSGIKPKDDDVDLKNFNGGFQGYMRVYWYLQEFPTDEAIVGWGDPGLPDLHKMSWTASNAWTSAFYSRILFQAAVVNEFLRESSDAKLASRGIANTTEIKNFRAEARFIRALVYSHGIDLYGSLPLVTEKDKVGSDLPKQATRQELFTFLETELKALENELPDARKNEYGRADKAAAWMTLSKLYLNAEVYIGQKKYTEAAIYAKKVVDAGYNLEANYAHNFLADNHTSKENIFSINFDGNETQTWGGTTTLIHGSIGGNMDPKEFGVDGGWNGFRTTKEFYSTFTSDKTDKRAMFYTNGQELEIEEVGTFTNGYAVTKWKNIDRNGKAGKNATHTDTDFPLFRLAEANLIYAEAVTRGGSGDATLALSLVNALRKRAGTSNLTALSIENIFSERSKELYWEANRRTDLIRFGKFTSGYTWAWKGGIKAGKDVEKFRTLYPLSAGDLIANPNLKQIVNEYK